MYLTSDQKNNSKMLYILIRFFILYILITLSSILIIKKLNKGLDPFECGFSPSQSAHYPFSLHFFLLGIIFIVFDLEIILLFPLFKIFSYLGWVFCLLLIVGLIYEWYLGRLNWF